MSPVRCMHGAFPLGHFVRELFRSLLLRNELTNWIQRPQNQETTQFATIWYNSWLSGYITDFLDIRAHARPMQFVQYCFSGEKTFWKKRKNFLGSICVGKRCSALSDDVTHSISIYMLFLKTWQLSPNALWTAPTDARTRPTGWLGCNKLENAKTEWQLFMSAWYLSVSKHMTAVQHCSAPGTWGVHDICQCQKHMTAGTGQKIMHKNSCQLSFSRSCVPSCPFGAGWAESLKELSLVSQMTAFLSKTCKK